MLAFASLKVTKQLQVPVLGMPRHTRYLVVSYFGTLQMTVEMFPNSIR